jgi:hypothetical protein
VFVFHLLQKPAQVAPPQGHVHWVTSCPQADGPLSSLFAQTRSCCVVTAGLSVTSGALPASFSQEPGSVPTKWICLCPPMWHSHALLHAHTMLYQVCRHESQPGVSLPSPARVSSPVGQADVSTDHHSPSRKWCGDEPLWPRGSMPRTACKLSWERLGGPGQVEMAFEFGAGLFSVPVAHSSPMPKPWYGGAKACPFPICMLSPNPRTSD